MSSFDRNGLETQAKEYVKCYGEMYESAIKSGATVLSAKRQVKRELNERFPEIQRLIRKRGGSVAKGNSPTGDEAVFAQGVIQALGPMVSAINARNGIAGRGRKAGRPATAEATGAEIEKRLLAYAERWGAEIPLNQAQLAVLTGIPEWQLSRHMNDEWKNVTRTLKGTIMVSLKSEDHLLAEKAFGREISRDDWRTLKAILSDKPSDKA